MKREQGPNTTLWWSFSRDHVFFYPADFEVGCCVLYRTRTRFFRALAGPYVRARPRTGAQTHPAPCSRAATPARQFCGWAPRLRHPANGVRTAHDPANETLLQAPRRPIAPRTARCPRGGAAQMGGAPIGSGAEKRARAAAALRACVGSASDRATRRCTERATWHLGIGQAAGL